MPLLRFSTTSLAEKKTWLQFLSEACAYCDSDTFYNKYQMNSNQDDIRSSSSNLRQYLQSKGNHNAPSSSSSSSPHHDQQKPSGTLPAMYFEPAPTRRFPSHSQLHTYIKVSKDVQNVVKSNRASYPPSKPMHREAAPSYLSHDAKQPQNYRGILNLGILILLISNFRLILQTIAENGFILTHVSTYFLNTTFHPQNTIVFHVPPLLVGILVLNVAILLSYSMEYALSRNIIFPIHNHQKLGMCLHYTMAHVFGFLLPNAVVWYLISSPFVGAFYLLFGTVTWMKLLSYIHANQDYRNSSEQLSNALISDLDEESVHITYPDNVSLKNIYYFMLAPTLTYQMAFPRMRQSTIRWRRVASLLLQLFFCASISMLIIGQVVTPQLTLLLKDLETYQEPSLFTSNNLFGKYLLRLTLANTYVWLLGFFCLFHLWLNVLAELLRFGDCVFYRDWWNSSEVSAYWRLWNVPVHYWLVRHLYFPCIRCGCSKSSAMFMVFFFSAVMHEVLISVPFHMIRPWAFMGMMGQIPLVFLTKYIDKRHPGSSFGNITFWVSFCFVGQPMACLMYTIDYWKQQQQQQQGLVDATATTGIMYGEL